MSLCRLLFLYALDVFLECVARHLRDGSFLFFGYSIKVVL